MPSGSTPRCSTWTSSPANRGRTPRSCASRGPATTTTSASSASAPPAGPERRGAVGLYHLAWQLDTIDELAAARQTLLDAGAYTGESSHGATKSIYGADPDGNEFELMWMLPRDQWGHYENAAPIDPLDLPGEIRRWTGVRTAGTIEDDARGTPS